MMQYLPVWKAMCTLYSKPMMPVWAGVDAVLACVDEDAAPACVEGQRRGIQS